MVTSLCVETRSPTKVNVSNRQSETPELLRLKVLFVKDQLPNQFGTGLLKRGIEGDLIARRSGRKSRLTEAKSSV
jgi:hypothetical protein